MRFTAHPPSPHSNRPPPASGRRGARVSQSWLSTILTHFDQTVWANGERKGVMVRPGMTLDHGDQYEPVGRLEGPLRWAVDVQNASVLVAGPLPPPA